MEEKERLSLAIYNIAVGIKETISLPTDKTLAKTLIMSGALFLVSFVSWLLGLYTFISWQGCLICTIFLVVLLFVERRENDALLKMYSNARLHTEQALQRAKATSARISNGRDPIQHGAAVQNSQTTVSNGSGSNKRRAGSSGSNKNSSRSSVSNK